MRWVAVALFVALAVVLPAVVAPVGATNSTANTTDDPRIVELYVDPVADEDAGEFVTIEMPAGTTLENFTLIDEQVPVSLAGTNDSRFSDSTRVTFSTAPARTRRLTDRTVSPLPDRVRLANGGDTLTLRRNGTTVQRVRYDDADESAVYDVETGGWYSLQASNFSITTATGGDVQAFVLPDEPTRAVEFLASAESRLYLAGYTLSSRAVVEELIAAHNRGVRVKVLVDGAPAGGTSEHVAAALADLSAAGVDLRVVDGPRARVRFHHAKYAVVDDRALVTTENWKPSGLGGQSSRGWAAITDQHPIVAALNRTFHADRGWVDAKRWRGTDTENAEPPTKEYPTEFETSSFDVQRTELLLAPDNAERRLRRLFAGATGRIRIEQMSIDPEFPLLDTVVDAAERGVEVEILLSGAWYVEAENERLARRLNDRASADNLPLEVRVADPEERFEKIHAKGVIVDGETTVVGSLNWNNNSFRRNREVALLVESEGVATYFGRVFQADWTAAAETRNARRVPVGLLGAVVVAAALTVAGARRIDVEPALRPRG